MGIAKPQAAPMGIAKPQAAPMGIAKQQAAPPASSSWKRTATRVGMRAAGVLGSWLSRAAGSRAGGRCGILTYHRITQRIPGLPPPSHNVAPERFRRQLLGLLAAGFQVWPLRRILAAAESGETIPPRTIAVTFDDGFQSVYRRAWPILWELKIPATVFVCTAGLDNDEPFWFDAWGHACRDRAAPETFRSLTTDQCRRLLDGGLMELGAHTHTHGDFRGRPEALRCDLQTCVDILRSRFDLDVIPFAFPFGSPHEGTAGEALATAARRTGVVCGLTAECMLIDPRSDPFTWGRFNVFSWDTPATLIGKLDGWYDWAPRLRRAVARRFPEPRQER
jgi:peptidoglycan/xylan/chitin deacetylase (PgdA/CDA1 family)